MNLNIKIGKYRVGFLASVRRDKGREIIGYTNRCKDGAYIVFLDYDNLELSWIEGELKRLQDDFKLSHFYIFKSSDSSYHAVCFDKVSLKTFLQILDNSSCDFAYRDVPFKFGRKIWTLRINKKVDNIKFIKVLSSDRFIREKSKAHIDFIKNIFKIEVDNHLQDNSKEVIFSRYTN